MNISTLGIRIGSYSYMAKDRQILSSLQISFRKRVKESKVEQGFISYSRTQAFLQNI